MVLDGVALALVCILLGEAAIESRDFFQLPAALLRPPSMGQLPVQDWLFLLYQDSGYLSFAILHLFCKLFSHDALHLPIQRLRAVITASDGVNRAANLLL